VTVHEGRGTHPLVTWGVREPTNLLAPPDDDDRAVYCSFQKQGVQACQGLHTFRWRHLASEEDSEEFGAVLATNDDGESRAQEADGRETKAMRAQLIRWCNAYRAWVRSICSGAKDMTVSRYNTQNLKGLDETSDFRSA